MGKEMSEHLAETVDVFGGARSLYEPRVLEPRLHHSGYESPPLCVDLLPPPSCLRERAQIGSLWNGRVGLPQPPMQPQLLGPDDVTQRAVDPAVAALQVAEILLVRQPGDRVEDRAIRPAIVVEQLEELVH